jgi:hypothetical protein
VKRLLFVVLFALLALPSVAQAKTVKVYFTRGEQLVSAPREAAEGVEPAIRALLTGPTTAERKKGYGTAIASSTTLTSVVAGDDKVTINLSNDFGAVDARYLARVAQVVYTATAAGAETIEIRGREFTRDDFVTPDDYEAPKTPKVTVKAPKATRTIQRRLAALGYLTRDAVNGKYDYRTQQAVLAFQAWEGLDRDGVAGTKTQARLADAGRPKPQEDEDGKYVEVYRDRGVVLLVEDGRVTRAIHTSTGVGQNSTDLGTPTGEFEITRKEQRSWLVPFKQWAPYAAYWNGGYGFYGAADVPAGAASFGGARIPLPEAKIVWGFVDVGTPVRVI